MKLDDRLYQEVDDSCALCGLRGIDVLGIHHIDGISKNNVYENTIVLCHNCHRRFHDNKGVTESHVRDRKRHLIHKTLTIYGLNALKIADRNGTGVVAMPFLLHHLVDLGYMEQNEPVMGYDPVGVVDFSGSPSEGMFDVAQEDALARFSITDRGRGMLAAWF
jgi:hypothetical protein